MKYHLLSFSSETLLCFDRPAPACSPIFCVLSACATIKAKVLFISAVPHKLLHVSVDATKVEGRQLPVAPLQVLTRYSKGLRYWARVSISGETVFWVGTLCSSNAQM
jgi:hypothetical protein